MRYVSAVVVLAPLAIACTARADLVLLSANQQYNNVHFDSATSGLAVIGEVQSYDAPVQFEGFGPGPTFAPLMLHAGNGVAFVEPADPAASMHRITITAIDSWLFNAVDLKLDAKRPLSGLVTFRAYDATGALIPSAFGLDTLPISPNGQNPYHLFTSDGSSIRTLEITSTVPLADIKQVSMIPGPGSAALLACAGLVATRRRR